MNKEEVKELVFSFASDKLRTILEKGKEQTTRSFGAVIEGIPPLDSTLEDFRNLDFVDDVGDGDDGDLHHRNIKIEINERGLNIMVDIVYDGITEVFQMEEQVFFTDIDYPIDELLDDLVNLYHETSVFLGNS